MFEIVLICDSCSTLVEQGRDRTDMVRAMEARGGAVYSGVPMGPRNPVRWSPGDSFSAHGTRHVCPGCMEAARRVGEGRFYDEATFPASGAEKQR